MWKAQQLQALLNKARKSIYSDFIVTRDDRGRITKLVLNSSLITSLFFTSNKYDSNALSDYCPAKIKAVYLDGKKTLANKYMERGLYFEYKVLGVNTGVTELPLTAKGKRSVIHDRIDQQIDMFNQLCDKNGVIVTKDNVQVEKYVQLENFGNIEVFLKGKFDLVSPITYEGVEIDAAVIDLKLTGDLEGGWWSKYVDTTQGQLYSLMSGLPFFYWIFDYTPYLRNQIRRVITPVYYKEQEKDEALIRKAELQEKIRKTIEIIVEHEDNGYPTNSNTRECKDCPLNPDNGGTCKMATQITVM